MEYQKQLIGTWKIEKITIETDMENKIKKALIIGANGQDASYLAEFLLTKNYIVHGTIRRNSVPESQTTRIHHLHDKNLITLHYADLTDALSIESTIQKLQPDEIYHLAAQSHVQISFELPQYTLDVNGGGTLGVLEAVRRFSPHSKVYHAATSEMFGNSKDSDGFQRETTPMMPVSPYGCAKLYAHTLCRNYSQAYGIFACSGILFNHESPRRGINFVTNKVALQAAKIKLGMADKLVLGNMNAKRDWGHAKDYVEAMWLMLQNKEPDSFVIATGETRTVKEMVDYVFDKIGLDSKKYVETSEKYCRPEELHYLRGDATKARTVLGWNPKITFEEMMDEMVDYWIGKLSKSNIDLVNL
jgi:GDPmannose 4,6-dehydratase